MKVKALQYDLQQERNKLFEHFELEKENEFWNLGRREMEKLKQQLRKKERNKMSKTINFEPPSTPELVQPV